MKISFAAVFTFLALAGGAVPAQTTTTVVDIPSHGVTQRFLYVRPAAPIANIIGLPGGAGYFEFQSDGTIGNSPTRCFPIYRVRQALADRGFAIAFVDWASDGSFYDARHASDVLAYMQQRDNVPTWLIGGSNSTGPIANLAGYLPAGSPVGVIFFSPNDLPAATAASVRRPAQVVYHVQDGGPTAGALFNALTSPPIKEIAPLDGGTDGGCGGYHLFNGIEDLFIAAIAGFMERNNSTLTPTVAVAIEYYHEGLDHYFITHRADQIQILDEAVLIKGWTRTGQSFNVYLAARPDTSPVCRFYIPPAKGNSHYYGRDPVECDATARNEPTFINEDPQFFHIVLPTAGTCPAGTRNVYRVFSNRPDVNHRYMVDRAIRDQMVALGWLAEGAGPDIVVMCSPT